MSVAKEQEKTYLIKKKMPAPPRNLKSTKISLVCLVSSSRSESFCLPQKKNKIEEKRTFCSLSLSLSLVARAIVQKRQKKEEEDVSHRDDDDDDDDDNDDERHWRWSRREVHDERKRKKNTFYDDDDDDNKIAKNKEEEFK